MIGASEESVEFGDSYVVGKKTNLQFVTTFIQARDHLIMCTSMCEGLAQ